MLPEEVLQQAAAEMLDYQGSGQSVMEMSHRSKVYEGIIGQTEADVKKIFNVPSNYKVLFTQGGAWTQFAMVPMNLMAGKKAAAYVDTGMWSSKALGEAKLYGTVNVIASSKDKNYSYIPEIPAVGEENAYLHITTNNTIFGTKYSKLPNTGKVPLVADMSSNIASEAIDIGKFGLIYAGAQKNLGPAGVVLVFIREDLLGDVLPGTPTMLQYRTYAENESMFNTPPCYSIYILGLVMKWIETKGGIPAVEKLNRQKAGLLYDAIDNLGFYTSPVRKEDRSLMNIPFLTPNEDLNKKFEKECDAAGLVNLKGHRSVGGLRASIYNAMPLAGVEKLAQFMRDFAKKNG
jgi:phosphoserine aminotransferase